MKTNKTILCASALAVGALGACGDDAFTSDLDSGGAPEVLTVSAESEIPIFVDGSLAYFENATFCNRDAAGRTDQLHRELCPALEEGETDAMAVAVPPLGGFGTGSWYVRVVFDELLDGDAVEDLITDEMSGITTGSIATTQPVALSCGGSAVDYDGWYDPTGNSITTPPGPSLVVTSDPGTYVGAGASCTVTVNDVVVDKSGNEVDAAQLGPYEFQLAALASAGTAPANDEFICDTGASFTFNFNGLMSDMNAGAGAVSDNITLVEDPTGAATPVAFTVAASGPSIVVTPDSALTSGNVYQISLTSPGGTEVQDVAGSTLDLGGSAITVTVTADSSFCF